MSGDLPEDMVETTSDISSVRLLFRNAFCIRGAEAARLFYGSEGLIEQCGDPPRIEQYECLFPIDNKLTLENLAAYIKLEWLDSLPGWIARGSVIMQNEMEYLLCKATYKWLGFDISNSSARLRTHEFSEILKGRRTAGPDSWHGNKQRRRAEFWASGLIHEVRNGTVVLGKTSALAQAAWHRNSNGELYTSGWVGRKLVDTILSVIESSRFITFAALGIHEHPECRERLASGDENYTQNFIREVRRFYPLLPLAGGRVIRPFVWKGHSIDTGTYILLDIYGTNHDERLWQRPGRFSPERFENSTASLNVMPQEQDDLSMGIVNAAITMLMRAMDYTVPRQDLGIYLSASPTIPQSGFLIDRIKAASVSRSGSNC
jgi:fatty-acid peroxygenase